MIFYLLIHKKAFPKLASGENLHLSSQTLNEYSDQIFLVNTTKPFNSKKYEHTQNSQQPVCSTLISSKFSNHEDIS